MEDTPCATLSLNVPLRHSFIQRNHVLQCSTCTTNTALTLHVCWRDHVFPVHAKSPTGHVRVTRRGSMSLPTTTSMPPPAPPQRQSCDRCYRQKLRCKRTKNTNGDVCDRCLSKPADCVYSTSLPKGRPSLRRLAVDAPNNTSADDATSARDAIVPITAGE
jgi:hypothetical protein